MAYDFLPKTTSTDPKEDIEDLKITLLKKVRDGLDIIDGSDDRALANYTSILLQIERSYPEKQVENLMSVLNKMYGDEEIIDTVEIEEVLTADPETNINILVEDFKDI